MNRFICGWKDGERIIRQKDEWINICFLGTQMDKWINKQIDIRTV